MANWRSLLIVYLELDVTLNGKRYHHVATEQEIADATNSFRAFPRLAARLTSGAARVRARIIKSTDALFSLSREGDTDTDSYWPSPDDTRRALDEFAPTGTFESIFIFWPRSDFATGTAVPCRGWGLGMGASNWSNRATYGAISNAPSSAWKREARGEVWLHEWLHGVCHHFAGQGHSMPKRDADGGEIHGYERSPRAGWTSYYRDLMSGNVVEDGRRLGIPLAAWAQNFEQSA